MSFVSLGGGQGVRPTFFELIAADRLMPSLKSAAIYSLSVSSSPQGLAFLIELQSTTALNVNNVLQ